jgi:hypothetical protein
MSKTRSTLLAAAMALATLGAWAQAASSPAATPGVDQRQANQDKRIDQGVASGSLTARETQRLEREQATMNRAEDKAKADGTVTRQERRHLNNMQDRRSRAIARQKHDPQHR